MPITGCVTITGQPPYVEHGFVDCDNTTVVFREALVPKSITLAAASPTGQWSLMKPHWTAAELNTSRPFDSHLPPPPAPTHPHRSDDSYGSIGEQSAAENDELSVCLYGSRMQNFSSLIEWCLQICCISIAAINNNTLVKLWRSLNEKQIKFRQFCRS